MQTGLRSAIALESNKGLGNLRGTLGMARNAAADSATSQFYFNVADNLGFDYVNASNPGMTILWCCLLPVYNRATSASSNFGALTIPRVI